jgi:hypothetical protein
MEVFEGTVRLAGDPEALPAVLVVADNRLTVSARQQELGDWQLGDVSSSLEPDGCHVVVEGEELVVSVPELLEFAAAIGPHVDNPGDGSLRELEPRQDDEADSPDPPDPTVRRSPLPRMVQLGVGAAVVAIGLAIWAPVVLVGLILLAALSSLLIGGFALLDPYLAVRMPDPLSPSLLFRAGVAGSIAALGLAVIL